MVWPNLKADLSATCAAEGVGNVFGSQSDTKSAQGEASPTIYYYLYITDKQMPTAKASNTLHTF